jgi:hypothetical protein
MQQIIEDLIVLGLLGLLILLRLDAPRFGVAEYDDSGRNGSWRAWFRRLAWFGLGTALVLLVYLLYPQQISVLHLDIGGTVGAADRGRAMLYGFAIGTAGILAAAVFAWGRHGGIRLPIPGAYPGAIVNSIGTAAIDEATFRGILLGLLLGQGIGTWVAIGIAAVVYGIATRLTARGRSKGMLLIDLLIAIVCGWTVVETGGIGAAVLGHAITRFAIFLLTGRTDQSRPLGWEPEAVEGRALPPKGWDVLGRTDGTKPWTMNVVGADRGIPSRMIGNGSAYAGESPFAGQGYGQPGPQGPMPPGPMVGLAPGLMPAGPMNGAQGPMAPGPMATAPMGSGPQGPMPNGPPGSLGYGPPDQQGNGPQGPWQAQPAWVPDAGPYGPPDAPAGPPPPDTGRDRPDGSRR